MLDSTRIYEKEEIKFGQRNNEQKLKRGRQPPALHPTRLYSAACHSTAEIPLFVQPEGGSVLRRLFGGFEREGNLTVVQQVAVVVCHEGEVVILVILEI